MRSANSKNGRFRSKTSSAGSLIFQPLSVAKRFSFAGSRTRKTSSSGTIWSRVTPGGSDCSREGGRFHRSGSSGDVQCKINALPLTGSNIGFPGNRAGFEMNCFECISARWQAGWKPEQPIGVGDGKVGMLHDGDIGEHPGMDVTPESYEDFGTRKTSLGHRVLDRLSEIELPIVTLAGGRM